MICMKMLIPFLLLLLLAFSALPAAALSRRPVATPLDAASEARLATLEHRLEVIKAMNLHDLPRAERKALREEVRAIKKEMATISGGVYISVGALLLIALLLILLL